MVISNCIRYALLGYINTLRKIRTNMKKNYHKITEENKWLKKLSPLKMYQTI